MNAPVDAGLGMLMRVLRSVPARMAVLYAVLTYLYLAGYFFRGAMTHGPVQSVLATVLNCVLMLGAYAVIVRVMERRPASELPLNQRLREFGLGLVGGFGFYAACVLILVVLGYCAIVGIGTTQTLLPGIAVTLATGVYEELWFRGTIYRMTEEWFGTWIALVVSSAIFGYVHLSTEGATVMDVTFISIEAGILLAAAYILTRRLWLSIGFHFAWNFTQGYIFSGSVSGNAAPAGLIKTTTEGPKLITGGSFGMEASIVALTLMTTAGVIMLVMAHRRGRIVSPPWLRKG